MAETMKGYVFKDVNDLRLEDRPIPTIQDPRDAIVKVALSSICASDFHIKVGAVPSANKDIILGHEFAGEVVAVGDACKKIKVGDRVVANVETFCGECFFCEHGYVNNCVEGGWYLGHKIDGCQTEYVRVPIADNGLELIPDNLTYKDVLAVSCVLPSGYFGAELAEIKEGDTVVVLGCGPCGYTSMMSARLFKPARIIAVDRHDERGQFALDHGWADVFINSKKEDVEARVKELTEAGVNVSFGHDDIFDPWYPMGTGSLRDVVFMGLHVCQMMGYEDIMNSYRFISTNAAKTLHLGESYGIRAGNPASFIVLDAKNYYDALNTNATVLLSCRNGRVVAEGRPGSKEAKF